MHTTIVSHRIMLVAAAAAALLAGVVLLIASQQTQASTTATKTVSVRISGGHETNPVDHGRPVVLVAAGLGVPTEVFRQAFSGVTPAGAGQEPEPGQVDRNKQALLAVLAPYGVTNDDLDRVSNYYRYNASAGEVWKQSAASAKAVIRNGKVVSLTIVAAGAGYSSTPTVTVPGYPAAKVKATVAYGKDLATNGSLASLTLG